MEEKSTSENAAPSKGGMKVLWIVVAVIVVGGVYFLTKSQPAAEKNAADEKKSQTQSESADQAVKEFDLSAKSYEFSIKEIKVKKGDTVKINLKNTQGLHDWVVDEFNAKTKQLKAGESDSITFVADKAGTFEFYCSVMTHRQMGMVGKLIVE